MPTDKRINFTFWILNIAILLTGFSVLFVSDLPLIVLCYAVGIIGIVYGASKIVNFLFTSYKKTIFGYSFSIGLICIALCVYIMLHPLTAVVFLPYAALLLTFLNMLVKFQNAIDFLRAKSITCVITLFFCGGLAYLLYVIYTAFQNVTQITPEFYGYCIIANTAVNIFTRAFLVYNYKKKIEVVSYDESDDLSDEVETKFDTLEFDITNAIRQKSSNSDFVLRPSTEELSGTNLPDKPLNAEGYYENDNELLRDNKLKTAEPTVQDENGQSKGESGKEPAHENVMGEKAEQDNTPKSETDSEQVLNELTENDISTAGEKSEEAEQGVDSQTQSDENDHEPKRDENTSSPRNEPLDSEQPANETTESEKSDDKKSDDEQEENSGENIAAENNTLEDNVEEKSSEVKKPRKTTAKRKTPRKSTAASNKKRKAQGNSAISQEKNVSDSTANNSDNTAKNSEETTQETSAEQHSLNEHVSIEATEQDKTLTEG